MKTIAQQLGVTEFPFEIKDFDGNVIYHEERDGSYYKKIYDLNGNVVYHEDSGNIIVGSRIVEYNQQKH